jgi:tetratricopeptide (TPR) repeat protein
MDRGAGKTLLLRSLFARALQLAPDRRQEFLSDPTMSPETRDELLALLEADLESETYLLQTIDSERPSALGVGERFGPYQTTGVLGHGGMGVVFRADRRDGEFNQTVAIKVVRHAWFEPRAAERFRQERQLLSGLTHPNIARLLDGGTRGDGVAYLVMEYVDGVALDVYCHSRRLTVPERIRLFLPLCEAVEYAHSRLIVHRDLKPSNVLVTASGEPKLLDFGIARALDSQNNEARSQTRTLLMTPEFASPEQARGEPATTQTDVYGLGGVLYFLLTGQPTHRLDDFSPGDLRQAICETAPRQPSQWRPELKGDLENILLKALHPEPGRRYRSARELHADLQRYLERRPVLATPDGWAYRAKRFFERHKVTSIAAALAAIAIVTATAVSLYQAHRAQQRFDQVRKLANKFVFDFEAAIRDTPGTLEARRMVASTARQYLADLSADARNNLALKRELANSYYALARAESSAGENDVSLDHLKEARRLHRELGDHTNGTPQERLRYITTVAYLARFMTDSKAPEQSLTYGQEALDTAQAWLAQSPADPLANRAMAVAQSNMGIVLLNRDRPSQGVNLLLAADQRFEQLVKQFLQDDDLSFQMARAELSLANSLPGAEPSPIRLKMKARVDRYLARHPSNIRWRNLAIYAAASNASIMGQKARKDPAFKPQAVVAYREAYDLAKVKAQQSPGDALALDDLKTMASRLGNELVRQNSFKQAEPYLLEANQIADQLLKIDPADRRNLYQKANSLLGLGNLYGELRRRSEQAQTLTAAETVARHVLIKWPDDLLVTDLLVAILENRTSMHLRLGHTDQARAACEQGLRLASDLLARTRDGKSDVFALHDLRVDARKLGLPDPTAVASNRK